MYKLIKTDDTYVPEIRFDRMESLDLLGPFSDIITEYSKASGIRPTISDYMFCYKFVEDGRAISFYWNNGFTIYVYGISRAQYQSVYERLYRICADLNRKLYEKRY